jgi:hypothetical protein
MDRAVAAAAAALGALTGNDGKLHAPMAAHVLTAFA